MLLTVDVQSLHSPSDLRLLDGSCLAAHLTLLVLVLDSPGVHCTQQELEPCMCCAAEVLRQTALRLLEVRRRALFVLWSLLARKCCAWTGRSSTCALQYKQTCNAFFVHTCAMIIVQPVCRILGSRAWRLFSHSKAYSQGFGLQGMAVSRLRYNLYRVLGFRAWQPTAHTAIPVNAQGCSS